MMTRKIVMIFAPALMLLLLATVKSGGQEVDLTLSVIHSDYSTKLVLPNPAYYTLWYEDPPSSAPSAADYDALAAFDLVVMSPFSHQPATAEPYFVGMRDSLISRNPDIALLSYIIAMTPRFDWSTYAVGSAERRCDDYLKSIPDSLGFGRNLAGHVAVSDAYPTRFVNFMNTNIADTMARYFVDSMVGSGIDGDYTGVFIDLMGSTLRDWICYDGDCTNAMDFDQDGIAYALDQDEKDAYMAWQTAFVAAIHREYRSHGLNKRLIVGNGDLISMDAQIASYADGYMLESWNRYTPGRNNTAADWLDIFDDQELLVNAQTVPPLVLFYVDVDSSSAFMAEPVALAAGVPVHTQTGTDMNGNTGIASMVRRLPDPGVRLSLTVTNDTIRVQMENYELQLSTSTATSDFEVWPYLVSSVTDTLSRGGGWPTYKVPSRIAENSTFIRGSVPDGSYHAKYTVVTKSFPSATGELTRDGGVGMMYFGLDQLAGETIGSATLNMVYGWGNTGTNFWASDRFHIIGATGDGFNSWRIDDSNTTWNAPSPVCSWPKDMATVTVDDIKGTNGVVVTLDKSDFPDGSTMENDPFVQDITEVVQVAADHPDDWAGIWLAYEGNTAGRSFNFLSASQSTRKPYVEYTLGDNESPSTISDLTASAATPGQVALAWTAATDNVGLRATNPYGVYRNTDGSTYSRVGWSQTNSYTDTAVSRGTTCHYVVVAFDEAGNFSVDSNRVSVRGL